METISESKATPKGYLLLFNVGKKKNFGSLLRSACAFGFEKVFLISDGGKKKPKAHKEFNFFGNQGTIKEADFEWFNSLTEAKEYFVKNNIYVCGIEIMAESESVVKHPFKGSTVFMLGNEGSGLNTNQKKICDHYVYIPQYTAKTASLNIAIAGSIIFHHFAVWAGFPEAPMYGEKFQNVSAEPLAIEESKTEDSSKAIKEKPELQGENLEGVLPDL